MFTVAGLVAGAENDASGTPSWRFTSQNGPSSWALTVTVPVAVAL
jgi:hypothetical protein